MGERIKGILGLLLIFGLLLIIAGITGISEQTQNYGEPIYISQEIRLETSGDGSKIIKGTLTNRTDQDIHISLCKIYLSNGNNLYSTYDIKDFTIKSYGFYNINISNINEVFTKAHISRCVINNKDCDLKYSNDGITFDYSSSNHSTSKFMLISGITLLLAATSIIIHYFIKKKTIKY